MQKKWWHGKVAYQIYPKSFNDTNGDGIGDIAGIIEKLDYLQELGIEILWISPIYCSPLADQGYDISDYYNIDPRFGTMEEMDLLIAEAKKRGISILMDLVVNHCSDEHIWFKKACQDPNGKYGKFFYILDAEKEGPPCNWRSYFGGSVWDKLPGHEDKYYLHVFHKKQPDLNWENPELRREIYKMINWWLEKGIDGFRIDAIINIKKSIGWKDYPTDPKRDDGLSSIDYMLEDAQGIGVFLGELRDQCFKKYDAFTVGEVFNEKKEELNNFIGDNGYFSTMFDFRPVVWCHDEKGWYANKEITPNDYRSCLFESQAAIEGIGYISNIIENHDEPRGVSQYIKEEDLHDPAYSLSAKKLLATLNFSLKGLPFMYQGQEIGMENVAFTSIDQVDDISTLDEYKVALAAGLTPDDAIKKVGKYSRDNSRTPFQWDDGEHAGFTEGQPWLPVNPNYKDINLKKQRNDENSLYHYYRKLIALRKNPLYRETIVYGPLDPAFLEEDDLIAFYRKGQGQTLLVLLNYRRQGRDLSLPLTYKNVVLSNLPVKESSCNTIHLEGYQAVILEMSEEC